MSVLLSRLEDVKAFGRNDAAFLGQLDYWLKKAAGGKSQCVVRINDQAWVAKSRSSWCDETLLTPQQLRNVLERLKDAGVIIVERHLFNNRVTAHIRIDEEARQRRWGVVAVTPTAAVDDTQIKMGNSTKTIYIETQKRIERDSGQGFAPAVDEEAKTMGTVQDILAGKLRTTPVTITPATASKPGELALVFAKAWADAYPESFMAPMIAKHLGQLRQIAKSCPPGTAGKVVDHCVRHWQDFVSLATSSQGAWKQPQLPDLGFMLAFVQSAVNCWKGSQHQPKMVPTPKPRAATPKTAPHVAAPDSNAVTDQDEVAKLLGLG